MKFKNSKSKKIIKGEDIPKVFCYFHKADLDGWSSSAVVKKRYPFAEFYGYDYEEELPVVEGYDIVFMLDLSLSIDKMKELQKKNKDFIWIDHHSSKIREIEKKKLKISGLRDSENKNSACVLTWRYLYPTEKVPALLQYIEDIDLWNFAYNDTLPIVTALDIDEKEDRQMLEAMLDAGWWNDILPGLLAKGHLYVKLIEKQIDNIVKNASTKMWRGWTVSILNTPIHKSFIGDRILKTNHRAKFVILWSVDNDIVRVGLRGNSDINLGEIASKYGGGGHKQAAGFNISFNDFKKHVLDKLENPSVNWRVNETKRND